MWVIVFLDTTEQEPAIYSVVSGFHSHAKAEAHALDVMRRRRGAFEKSRRIKAHIAQTLSVRPSREQTP